MPSLANAQSTRDVLRDFGLLGTWATDCAEPAGKYNFWTVYAGMTNGNVKRTYYNTPDRDKAYNEYIITRAIRLPSSQLSYSQQGVANKDRIDVVLLKEANRYKIWSSVRQNGEVLVKERQASRRVSVATAWHAAAPPVRPPGRPDRCGARSRLVLRPRCSARSQRAPSIPTSRCASSCRSRPAAAST